MTFLESETYSGHSQTSTMKKSFAKNSYLAHFHIFCETELSYISGSNFPDLKSKKNPLLNSFLYLRNRNLKSLKNPHLEITKHFKGKGKRRRISQSSYKNNFAGFYF